MLPSAIALLLSLYVQVDGAKYRSRLDSLERLRRLHDSLIRVSEVVYGFGLCLCTPATASLYTYRKVTLYSALESTFK